MYIIFGHAYFHDPGKRVYNLLYPTANDFQVFLTQAYSPDGSADHIATFLIPQYALSECSNLNELGPRVLTCLEVLITITALSAYTLNILF